MKLLLISAVLGSLFSSSFSKVNLQSIIAFSDHLQSLEPAARNEFVAAAANVMAEEAHTIFPAGNRGIDIPGCIDCALKKILPSGMKCLSDPLGMFACALKSFDASCLISTCICSVFTILPEIVLQIFQMIGLCPRAGAGTPSIMQIFYNNLFFSGTSSASGRAHGLLRTINNYSNCNAL